MEVHSGWFIMDHIMYVIIYVEYGVWDENDGIPKWMVDFMEIRVKMDDLALPFFEETTI